MLSYETRMEYSFRKQHIIHIIGTTVRGRKAIGIIIDPNTIIKKLMKLY
jgi:hypothetical protein